MLRTIRRACRHGSKRTCTTDPHCPLAFWVVRVTFPWPSQHIAAATMPHCASRIGSKPTHAPTHRAVRAPSKALRFRPREGNRFLPRFLTPRPVVPPAAPPTPMGVRRRVAAGAHARQGLPGGRKDEGRRGTLVRRPPWQSLSVQSAPREPRIHEAQQDRMGSLSQT